MGGVLSCCIIVALLCGINFFVAQGAYIPTDPPGAASIWQAYTHEGQPIPV